MNTRNLTDDQFHTFLKNYLFSLMGAKFRKNFKFAETLECRSTQVPPIIVSTVQTRLNRFQVALTNNNFRNDLFKLWRFR